MIVNHRRRTTHLALVLAGGLALVTAGCAGLSAIEKGYAGIDYSDGIDSREAVYVAQKNLMSVPEKKDYKLSPVHMPRNRIVGEYPDYWFLEFYPKAIERNFWRYLVVVDKRTGKVRAAQPYIPLEVTDYDWVFEE